MPEFVREKAYRVLNRLGVAPSRARVLVLGVAYKRDLEDWRESPALEVMRLLEADGVQVHYHDPFVPEVVVGGQLWRSVPLEAELLAQADLVIITTDHSTVDYRWVVEQARAILDTRYATRGIASEKITLL